MMTNKMTIKELIIRITAPFIFIFIGSCIIFIFSKGVLICGIPKVKEIVKVEITDTINNQDVTYTDEEHIYLAVKMKNFLLYKINSSKPSDETGEIIIRYEDNKGNITEISADGDTLYYKGKALLITNPDLFVNFARDVFFC